MRTGLPSRPTSKEEQRGTQPLVAGAKRAWPDLLVILVTDRPDAGRSGFQVLDLARWQVGEPVTAVDLFAHPTLDIYRQNVEEDEALGRRIVTLLAGGA